MSSNHHAELSTVTSTGTHATLARALPPRWVIIILLTVVGLSLLASIPQLPSVSVQGRDSGIFAYTAKVIADGGLPYRDAWDNKPPGVYYINALAFELFGVNRWALWIMELGFTVATGVAFFALVMQVFRDKPLAVLGTTVFIFAVRSPALVGSGNFTESYALLPQVLFMLYGYRFLKTPSLRLGLLIGLLASFAFLIKQTTVGMALAFIPAILVTGHVMVRSTKKWVWLGSMIAGGLAGIGATLFYLFQRDVLVEAIDAAVISPMRLHDWISKGSTDLIVRLIEAYGLVLILVPFLLVVAFFAVSTAITVRYVMRMQRERTPGETAYATFVVWMALTFIVDLFLTNLTQRYYYHYYITPVPALVLLLLIYMQTFQQIRHRGRLHRNLLRVVTALIVLVPLASSVVIAAQIDAAEGPLLSTTVQDPLAVYVEAHTDPDDVVLVWGASSVINFQSLRRSPTQFHYGYPLIVDGYTEPRYIREILSDLYNDPPAMIIDRTLTDGIRVPPLDPLYREKWWQLGGRRDVMDLSPVYQWVADHCDVSDEVHGAVIFTCG